MPYPDLSIYEPGTIVRLQITAEIGHVTPPGSAAPGVGVTLASGAVLTEAQLQDDWTNVNVVRSPLEDRALYVDHVGALYVATLTKAGPFVQRLITGSGMIDADATSYGPGRSRPLPHHLTRVELPAAQ